MNRGTETWGLKNRDMIFVPQIIFGKENLLVCSIHNKYLFFPFIGKKKHCVSIRNIKRIVEKISKNMKSIARDFTKYFSFEQSALCGHKM